MVPKATTVPPATISLIWMILYPIILIVFGFVFVQAFRANVRWKIASPFAINLVANLLLMPIFAGLCNVQLAAVDILIVWATTLWCVTSAWTADKWVAVAQAPYFVRVPVHILGFTAIATQETMLSQQPQVAGLRDRLIRRFGDGIGVGLTCVGPRVQQAHRLVR
jgi:tryptophan-rich sensory protein